MGACLQRNPREYPCRLCDAFLFSDKKHGQAIVHKGL